MKSNENEESQRSPGSHRGVPAVASGVPVEACVGAAPGGSRAGGRGG